MVDKKPNSTNTILALSWKTGVAESVMIFSLYNSPVSFSFIPHRELLIENFLITNSATPKNEVATIIGAKNWNRGRSQSRVI